MTDTVALVVAAGRGTRAGGTGPKQYRLIGGIAMLERSLRALLSQPGIGRVLAVIHRDDVAEYATIAEAIGDPRLMPPCNGGDTRAASVRLGLEALAQDPPGRVLIHDAARPFVSRAVIDGVIAALDTHDGAFPALPVVDALWNAEMKPVSREGLLRAQTPQGFRYDAIARAHGAASADALDDVEIAQAAGLSVAATQGEEENFKVTTPEDFERAERMVSNGPDIRTGTGYDVHAFEPGDHVTLCGVDIPHMAKLKGHSDADVAMHALTDALYGALAEGDIGQWFPPSEARWKGAASHLFLEHAMSRVRARGYAVSHLDCTIICERPKIGPHAVAMREELSRITGLEMSRISVKATTSERLGFTGREEGIAAMATATLVRPW